MLSRQKLTIACASSAAQSGDTGPPVIGELVGVRWMPTVSDSGASMTITLFNKYRGVNANPGTGDTAGSLAIMADEDMVGTTAGYFKQLTIPQTHNDLFDTGASLDVPVPLVGECLRVKVIPAGNGAVTGTLFLYIKDAT